MELLKQKIVEQGVIVSDQVLKLDGLLNHQVDPQLTMQMGKEFAKRFGDQGVTRVITVESSGIAVAFATAYELGVPLVFARRKKTLLAEPDMLCERVPSFTKASSRIFWYRVISLGRRIECCLSTILSPMVTPLGD